LLVPPARKVRKAFRALRVMWAQLVPQGHKATPARPDLRAMLLPFPARLGQPAPPALKAFRAIMAQPDRREFKASKAIRDRKATPDLLGRRVQ
jgi:hypothetical protein